MIDNLRPAFIKNEDLLRWDEQLAKDELTPADMKSSAIFKEIFYAGFYLLEKLKKLGCLDHIMVKIQYTRGSVCFGNQKGPWVVAEELLSAYQDGTMEFVNEEKVSKEIE